MHYLSIIRKCRLKIVTCQHLQSTAIGTEIGHLRRCRIRAHRVIQKANDNYCSIKKIRVLWRTEIVEHGTPFQDEKTHKNKIYTWHLLRKYVSEAMKTASRK